LLRITFETHSTSVDNEAGIASGHYDAPLSATGKQQAVQLAARHRDIAHVWCSDLQRSYRTAEIAFAPRVTIHRDARLREVDYGHLSRTAAADISATRLNYIDTPYPEGESYRDVCSHVAAFLGDLPPGWHLIIGHRATWYALEHLLGGRDLLEVIAAPWHWQPGWEYRALFS
jgi:broad specificity phosphatase PhoE